MIDSTAVRATRASSDAGKMWELPFDRPKVSGRKDESMMGVCDLIVPTTRPSTE